MTQFFWQMILGHITSVILLVLEVVASTVQPRQLVLTPVLYLPTIAQPAFIQIGPISGYRRGRSIDLLVRGEITSTLNVPIYQVTLRTSSYNGEQLSKVVTTTPFLPATFPGQTNAYQVVLEGGLVNANVIQTEIISWTAATTQTYITPSFTFTPSINGVAGQVQNDAGVTLTQVTIAAWSLKEQADEVEHVLTVPLLSPDQIVSFTFRFGNVLTPEVPPDSIRVGVQAVASP